MNCLELKAFKGVAKEELSMIEVAHAILEEHGEVMDFSDLVNQIQAYLEKADQDIRENLPQFYTDLNIDGSFISLGDNRWGLRSWYPIDSIDEEVTHGGDEEEEEELRRKKRKKVNAFIDHDEDVIDYNDDDPEDTDLITTEEDPMYLDDDSEDETEEIAAYNSDLSEIGADSHDEADLPEGVEDDLTIIDDEDVDHSYDEDL